MLPPKMRLATYSEIPMPNTVLTPIRNVFHCFLKSSRLIIVPRWTMMNPTTTPASASNDDAVSRSSGNRPVRNPIRKMIEATNSDDSSDFVFFATKSLMVHTSMTTVKATTGFIELSSGEGGAQQSCSRRVGTAQARQ